MNVSKSLIKYAWLSVIASIVIIVLKTSAYMITDSVGLLSDALESLVNLAGGLMAVMMLSIAARPADECHPFGHSKAEYFSSGVEGGLIIIAASLIIYAAIERIIHPHEIEQVGLGIGISIFASIINLAVAVILFKVGKTNNSITLIADAKHLFTDVLTTAGVVIGLVLANITGYQIIDPIIGLLVALNIIWAGLKIIIESVDGLMDSSLPAEELENIKKILRKYVSNEILFHALLSRKSGNARFVSFHAIVPGAWSIKEGHDFVEKIEREIKQEINNIDVLSHIEPFECETSWDDVGFGSTIEKSTGDF